MITHAGPPAGTGPAPLPGVPAQRDTSRRLFSELDMSARTAADGYQVVTVSGELDIATAEQAYAYLSEVIDHAQAAVSVDMGGVTFCDASGLGMLARIAKLAKEKGRQLRLISARPSLLKIMRITGLDKAFPELGTPVLAV